jgi:hypothetical protein
LIGFHGEEIVGFCVSDRARNGRVRRNGVDRDQRIFEAVVGGKSLDQKRNGRDFVGVVRDRLLAENETACGGEVGRV